MILMKTNKPGLMKDQKTGVILTSDQNKLKSIKEARMQYKTQKFLEKRVNILEQELQNLLHRIAVLENTR